MIDNIRLCICCWRKKPRLADQDSAELKPEEGFVIDSRLWIAIRRAPNFVQKEMEKLPACTDLCSMRRRADFLWQKWKND